MSSRKAMFPTSTHWGNYLVESDSKRILSVTPVKHDKNPSGIGQSMLSALDKKCRISQPMIRKSYLENRHDSNTSLRGKDPFVPVDWPTALDIAAEALRRVKSTFGNEAIYAGSYGWGSAGRFHHAQSQMHRFMKMFGGYTSFADSYSVGAGNVITSHILGMEGYALSLQAPSWKQVAEHAELVVLFGGAASKNAQASPGGLARHTNIADMKVANEKGAQFVNISPIEDDVSAAVEAEWLPLAPNTDTAVMLGIAHTLVSENLHDTDFLDTHCVGFHDFLPYAMGATDDQAKSAEWAETISGIPADEIRDLARRMARSKTMISVSWSIQRADKGEQPWWMATVLAAMLGEIGLPGRGIAYGYNCTHDVGAEPALPFKWAALPQGENDVKSFIPVARLVDMLLNPGDTFDYNGSVHNYPDIRLVYYSGGNPFHHHQDLNRLLDAWRKPETIIVNDHFWNASARHADIVFPIATTLERDDLGCNATSNFLIPMRRAVDPFGQSRTDYDIFSELADRLDFAENFTENRNEQEWIRHLYAVSKENAHTFGYELPEFEDFWNGEQIELETSSVTTAPVTYLEAFRRDPVTNPLNTPSGKVEIFSQTIDSFDYEDCPGHPLWLEPAEWLGSRKGKTYPLHLVSSNPKYRLHSQFDHGKYSTDSKVHGREPVLMHVEDARQRGIKDGDIVRVFNDRGACLAGARVSDWIRPGVVQLSTGAWYDPLHPGEVGSLDVHGNPNMLTLDKGSSKLSQGCSANTALVDIEYYDGPEHPIKVFSQPRVLQNDS